MTIHKDCYDIRDTFRIKREHLSESIQKFLIENKLQFNSYDIRYNDYYMFIYCECGTRVDIAL